MQLNTPINKNAINVFHHELSDNHNEDHQIYKIPAKYTLMDALCYIFNNRADSIADVLQSRVDGVHDAKALLESIESGIKHKGVCLTCIRDDVALMLDNKPSSRI